MEENSSGWTLLILRVNVKCGRLVHLPLGKRALLDDNVNVDSRHDREDAFAPANKPTQTY